MPIFCGKSVKFTPAKKNYTGISVGSVTNMRYVLILHFNNFTDSIWGSLSSPPQAFHTEFGNLGQNSDSATNSEINLPYYVNWTDNGS